MILKTCLLLVVSVAWEVSCASFSNVYVQTGAEPAAPAVEYLQYGAPSYSYATPQVAQYKAATVEFEYPFGHSFSYRTAYPEQTVAAVAPAAPSANIVYEYSAPISSLPVAIGGRSNPAGFEYSYTLVNQNAGPEMKQLSEGKAIRGGYTFFQPEGLVQYVTGLDNNEGFNAIFKNYMPNEVKHTETVHHAEPCHEARSGAITALENHPDHPEEVIEERHGEHNNDVHKDPHEHKAHPEDHEARHGVQDEPENHEPQEHHIYTEHIEHQEPHENGIVHEDHIIIIEHEHEGHELPEGHHEEHPEGHHELGNKEEVEPVERHAHPHEAEHTHEKIVEDPHQGHEHHAGHETTLAIVPEHPAVGGNVYISYNDFIKCIQAAMAKGTHPYYAPAPKPVSPLTYLVFNKPC